ncbi:hypothetical protein EJ04DRAFT_192963 [Polyplosphaeria fusca]|uniref:Uncharacterized protein n=1 Tax=Polyplosphaeria fusca TaxID=682080 RepID=A0A9P4R2K1_9PLEO|nr:hypothetical protein EJ04DRAFT_192963 [Polyplosphaeria fusca]
MRTSVFCILIAAVLSVVASNNQIPNLAVTERRSVDAKAIIRLWKTVEPPQSSDISVSVGTVVDNRGNGAFEKAEIISVSGCEGTCNEDHVECEASRDYSSKVAGKFRKGSPAILSKNGTQTLITRISCYMAR